MVEGAAYLGSWVFKTQDTPIFGNPRGENLLDSGAHNYDTFRTKDGMFMAVGSLEPQFYAALLQVRKLYTTGSATRTDVSFGKVLWCKLRQCQRWEAREELICKQCPDRG